MNAETSPTVGRSATTWPKLRLTLAIIGIGILIAVAAYWRSEAQLAAIEEIDIPYDCRAYVLSQSGSEYLSLSGRLAEGLCLRELNRSGEESWIYPIDRIVRNAAYLPDGQRVAIAEPEQIVVWNRESKRMEFQVHVTIPENSVMKASPDGRWIVIWDFMTGAAVVIDLKERTLTGTLPRGVTKLRYERHFYPLFAIRNDPDQLIRIQDRFVETWSLAPMQRLSIVQLSADQLLALAKEEALSNNGEILATSTFDDKLQLWDIRSDRLIALWPKRSDPYDPMPTAPYKVQDLRCTFAADDTALITRGSGSYRTFRLTQNFPYFEVAMADCDYIVAWDVKSQTRIRTWRRKPYGGQFDSIPGTNDFYTNIETRTCGRFRIK